MVRKTVFRWSAALVAVGMVMSACSSGDDSDDSDDGNDAAPARTSLEIAGPIGGNEPPHSSHHASLWAQMMYMSLIETDDNNELFSKILESWEVSDDARTVTLRLRSDLEWSDGNPVTSADVLMSLTQYLDPNISIHANAYGGVAGQQAFADGEADSIAGLSAPDEHTVVVELAEPNAGWFANLAAAGGAMPMLPHHVLGDVPHDELAEHEFFDTHPVTNGPYQFVEFVDQSHVELERNPNWSLGEAGFERVFVKELNAEVASTQLETGEVQFIQNVNPADADRVGAIDGAQLQSTTGVSPFTWMLMSEEPLLDPRVRQAMIYAIDRQGICEEVLKGYCSVPLTNVRQVGPEWAIPTEDMIEYRYDPDRARELLDEAGWDPSTELTLMTIEFDVPHLGSSMTIAQDNLADVGVDWEIENVDGPTLFESLEQASVDGAWLGGGNLSIDPSAVGAQVNCDAFYPDGSNLGRYCDPEVDELFDAARQEVDQDERAEYFHEAFRRLNRNPSEISFYVADTIVAHDERLKGVKVHPSTNRHYWNVGEWHWE